MVTFTGNSVGDTATYTCDPGFELIGTATTTCIQVDVNTVEFSPDPPACMPLCPDPESIDNGMVTFTGNSIDDTVSYTCDLGYKLIGTEITTCTQADANTAKFSPPPPVCIREYILYG
jgi:CUB/sushi domain-containing protein